MKAILLVCPAAAVAAPLIAAVAASPDVATTEATITAESRTGTGAATVTKVSGEVSLLIDGDARSLRAGEKVPLKASVKTAGDATVAITLSNGALMHLSGGGEMTLDVFTQEPFVAEGRIEEMAVEPSMSRVVWRLVRGELAVQVPRLRSARGSSLNISTEAGLLWTQTGATTFMAKAAALDVIITVVEGEMRFRPPSKDEITIAAGTQLRAEALGAELLREAEAGARE